MKIAHTSLAFTLLLSIGCGGSAETGAPVPSQESSSESSLEPKGNIIAGRVTMEDGSPLRGDIQEVVISIAGVSGPGERVNYTPIVKPDGTYRQKVASGMYSFSTSLFCYVALLYGDTEFHLPLEHVGRDWNKKRDSEEGIVQDFVLKFTGPTPYGKSDGLNPGNATHWYGESIGLLASVWRDDIKQSAFKIPAGTRLTFSLKPTGPAIDGSTIGPVTIDRVYMDSFPTLDLNDLMPAPYQVTGTATLPDGTTKPILLQGRGDYPNFKPSATVPLEKDDRGIAKFTLNFVIDS